MEGNRKTPFSHWSPHLPSGNNGATLGGVRTLTSPSARMSDARLECPEGLGRQQKSRPPHQAKSTTTPRFPGLSPEDVRWLGLLDPGSVGASAGLSCLQGPWKPLVLSGRPNSQEPRGLLLRDLVTSALLCFSLAGRLPEQHRQPLRGVLPPATQAFLSPSPIPVGSSLPTLLGTKIAGCSLCLTQVAPTLLEAPGPGVKTSDSCRELEREGKRTASSVRACHRRLWEESSGKLLRFSRVESEQRTLSKW